MTTGAPMLWGPLSAEQFDSVALDDEERRFLALAGELARLEAEMASRAGVVRVAFVAGAGAFGSLFAALQAMGRLGDLVPRETLPVAPLAIQPPALYDLGEARPRANPRAPIPDRVRRQATRGRQWPLR